MLARGLAIAALLLTAVPLLSGCAASTAPDVAEATAGEIAIYSSLPLQGPEAQASEQIVNGEKLALRQARGHAGRFKVAYISLDDAEPKSESWSAGVTATNAKLAAQDPSTIAYLGDYDSAATAVSLPLINGAGIAQVSPASPYVGLTSSLDAGQDEPERFYPSGKRTFVRLQPGDPVEAAAQVALMRALSLKSVYVLDDEDPFEVPLATIVAADAQRAGIAVPAHDSITIARGAVYTGEISKIVDSGAQAVFLAGQAGAGTVALWQQLHSADPQLKLLGNSALATESFAAALGAAGASTYLTTPVLAPSLYPPSAGRVLASYRSTFRSPATPEALYGYEAMSLVLDSIRAAGARGNDRAAVNAALFATRERDSVLGRYSIEASGETTLSRYGVDTVTHGRLAFYRAMEVPRSELQVG